MLEKANLLYRYQKPLDCIYTPNWEFVLNASGSSSNVRMVQEKTNKKQVKTLSEEEKQKKREEDEQNELYKLLSEKSFEQYKKRRLEIEKKKQSLQKLKKPTKQDIEMGISDPAKKDVVLKRCNSAVSMHRSTSRSKHFVTSWVDPAHPKHASSTTRNVDYYIKPIQDNSGTSTRPSTATTRKSSPSVSRPTTADSRRRDGDMNSRIDITNDVIRAKDKFELDKLDTGLIDFKRQTDRQYLNYPWINSFSPSFSFVNNVNYSAVDNHIPVVNLKSKSKRMSIEAHLNDLSYDVRHKIVERPISASNLDIYLVSGREKSGDVSTKMARDAATFQSKLVDEEMKKRSSEPSWVKLV